jgi:2-dehydro-3-deoxygluconokinase
MARIVCIGEGMLELRREGAAWQLGHGGDTLNTAIHLARAGHDVAYLTALGTDPFSAALKRQWQGEGLDTRLVLAHPRRHAGLYAIGTDDSGERSFTYWRETSAAREMFALPAMAEAQDIAAGADLVYFSLLTLAVLPADGRNRLLALARRVRARGGAVAFDSNYRAKLWPDRAGARAAHEAAIACADIGLPTIEDETALSGDADAASVARRWRTLGCREVIVKLGSRGCWYDAGGAVPPPAVLRPVDTSGAGDAFNAGYLAARLAGRAIPDAVRVGQRLAGCVIMRAGAIPPVPEWPGMLEQMQ